MNIKPLILVLLCAATSAFAQDPGLQKILKEMDVTFKIPEDGHTVALGKQDDVIYQIALGEHKKTIQARFSFFPVSWFEKQGIKGNKLKQAIPAFFNTIALNIAGGEKNIKLLSELDRKIYAGVYNADTGYGALISGRNSDFARHYDGVFVEGFYKKDRGLVVVSVLFDDANVLTDEDISTSFRFN